MRIKVLEAVVSGYGYESLEECVRTEEGMEGE